MGNFDFLEKEPTYGMFAKSAEKAEGLAARILRSRRSFRARRWSLR